MKTILAGAIFFACLAFMTPSPANAMCAYNKAKHRVTAMFNCGWDCHNLWSMGVGEHDCRPGKGGELKVTYIDWEHSPFMECDVPDIDAHGWVEIYEEEIYNYASNGSLKKKIMCVDSPKPKPK